MNSTILKEYVIKNTKSNKLIKDIWFYVNYGPAHFFKFSLYDGNEFDLYFNLNEELNETIVNERIHRKLYLIK